MSPTEREIDAGPFGDLGSYEPAAEDVWPPEVLELMLRKVVEMPGGEKLTFLRLREPTGEEWEAIFEQPPHLRRRFAVSRIAGVPMATAARIAIGDLARAETYLFSFFEIGQKISDW